MTRSHFTLVELLVVIAIIAVLASLLLPTLRRAKDKAKDVGCLSNLRSLGYGCSAFAQDHEGYVPASNTFPHPEGVGQYLWAPYAKLLGGAPGNGYRGYTGQGGAYNTATAPYCPTNLCPRVEYPGGAAAALQPYGPPGNSAYLHYGEGMWMTYYYGFRNPAKWRCMKSFTDLAPFFWWHNCDTDHPGGSSEKDGSNFGARRFFYAGNIVYGDGTTIAPSQFTLLADSYVYWYKSQNVARHDGRMNIAFLDLHAAPIRATPPYQMDAYGTKLLY